MILGTNIDNVTDRTLIWTGALNSDGYPRISFKGNSNIKVHRFVVELSTGKDITGLVVRHKCDNPLCINPNHLILGTNIDNVTDRTLRGRTHNQVTEREVNKVRLLRHSGCSYADIANLMEISYKRVEYIMNKYILY